MDRHVLLHQRTGSAELIGQIAQYEDQYRLCSLRGAPAGIIVALAEELV